MKCGCLSSFSSFYAGPIQLCECVGWEWSGKGTLGRSCGHGGLVAGAISFSSEGKQKVGRPSSVGHGQGPWDHNSAAKGISFCGPEMLSGWVGTTQGTQRHQWDSSLFPIKHTVFNQNVSSNKNSLSTYHCQVQCGPERPVSSWIRLAWLPACVCKDKFMKQSSCLWYLCLRQSHIWDSVRPPVLLPNREESFSSLPAHDHEGSRAWSAKP